jgi:hypothetical protein
VLGDATDEAPTGSLSEPERTWLAAQLDSNRRDVPAGLLEASFGVLIPEVPEAADRVIDLIRIGTGPNVGFAWTVGLTAMARDPRLAELACKELREKEHPWPLLHAGPSDGPTLGKAFAAGNPNGPQVAAAIEDYIKRFGAAHRDVALFDLAAVDQGPEMAGALLRALRDSTVPHWAAGALARHFGEQDEAAAALQQALFGEPVRASMIANVAPEVLSPNEAVSRLLDILGALPSGDAPGARRARFDIVLHALVQAVQATPEYEGERLDALVADVLEAIPPVDDPLFGRP